MIRARPRPCPAATGRRLSGLRGVLSIAAVAAAMAIGTARAAPDASDSSVLRPALASASSASPIVPPGAAPDLAPQPRLSPLQYAARRARSARHRAERAIRRRESQIRTWRRALAETVR